MLCELRPVYPQVPNDAPTQLSKRPQLTDSVSDLLPAGARLRLGTTRFHPPSGVAELALSPDEKTIVTIGDQIIARDPVTGKERWRGEVDRFSRKISSARYCARPIAFSSNSSRFFTPSRPNEIAIWETKTGKSDTGRLCVWSFEFFARWTVVGDGNFKRRRQVWDPLTGQKVWDRGQHQHYVYTVGFGRDSRTVVSGADDGLCYQWDLRPPEPHRFQDDLAKLYCQLGAQDSRVAYRAMWALCDSKDRSTQNPKTELRTFAKNALHRHRILTP